MSISRTHNWSTFRAVLGGILLLLGLSVIAARKLDGLTVSYFDWIYTFVFLINGAHHLFLGLGYRIVSNKNRKQ
jgi:uncharacterized integral membrane protein